MLQAVYRWLLDRLLDRLCSLSRETACRLGGSLGVLVFHVGFRRRVVSGNLGRCLSFSGRLRRQVARTSYASMGATFLELWSLTDGRPAAQLLNPAWTRQLMKGSGVVFVTGHLGNWDAAGAAVAPLVGGMSAYAKAQRDPYLDRRLILQHERLGMHMVYARHGDRTSALEVARTLRQGGFVGLIADQAPPTHEGLAGHLLGVPTHLHAGPATLSRLGRARLVCGFCLRRRAGESVVIVGRPWTPSGDDLADVQRAFDQVSAFIARFPGQYFWHHRRFKRPVDLPQRAIEPWQAHGVRLLVARA